jgi:hypothetical protein
MEITVVSQCQRACMDIIVLGWMSNLKHARLSTKALTSKPPNSMKRSGLFTEVYKKKWRSYIHILKFLIARGNRKIVEHDEPRGRVYNTMG